MWIGVALAAPEQVVAPAIKVEEATYNFKKVTQGEVIKHEFQVFNHGNIPLEIKKVKPG
jgi:hypothetical protein